MLHIELLFLLLSSVGGNAKTPMRQHRGFVFGIKKPPSGGSYLFKINTIQLYG